MKLKKYFIPELDILRFDTDDIITTIQEVLNDNPNAIADYKNGKDKVVGFIVGQVINKMQGNVDPALTKELVLKELRRR